MQYLWSRVKGGNFGDNLNSLLWAALLADIGWFKPGHAVYGIGSFEDIATPRDTGRVHVMGSGSTGPLRAVSGDRRRIRIHFVRGPRTAKIWGYTEGVYADGAVLLAHSPLRNLVPARKAETVGYVPHHVSDQLADYPYICRQAGVRYIGTKGYDTTGFIAQLKACDYIITEALHGAIVADLFRKPWAAVSSRRHINPYKWMDWCESAGLSYQPSEVNFVCSRGLRTSVRMVNALKRAVAAFGLGKAKWKQKRVIYDGRAAEDAVAQQIIAIRDRAQFVLSADAVHQRMIGQTGEILEDFKREVAA